MSNDPLEPKDAEVEGYYRVALYVDTKDPEIWRKRSRREADKAWQYYREEFKELLEAEKRNDSRAIEDHRFNLERLQEQVETKVACSYLSDSEILKLFKNVKADPRVNECEVQTSFIKVRRSPNGTGRTKSHGR